MILNYVALTMILIVIVAFFYLFIYIHELPYESAKHRNHPHQDAIWVACWLSLFTLHAIWPLVFIWALSHKKLQSDSSGSTAGGPSEELTNQLAQLENRLNRLEQRESVLAKGEPVKHG
jgi:hypothetical protein